MIASGQAERKVCPSTQKPDLDNANVGKFEFARMYDGK